MPCTLLYALILVAVSGTKWTIVHILSSAHDHAGRDINLEILPVEGYRKFCNKVFNATKFAMLKLDDDFVPQPTAKPTGKEGSDGSCAS